MHRAHHRLGLHPARALGGERRASWAMRRCAIALALAASAALVSCGDRHADDAVPSPARHSTATATASSGPAASASASAGTWAFTPPVDELSADALLDLRGLNERIAGESGFVRKSADGDGFVRGDGTPIRFWAVFDDIVHQHPELTAADLDRHARFLAKRGVNMVRVFADVTSDKQLDAIDAGARDQLWRTVAAMRKQGIYVFYTPIWMGGNRTKPELGFLDSHNGKWGDILFQRRLQDAFKSWMRQTLTVANPYTGIPLAQDPALAILMIDSEDSLLFWSSQGIKGAGKQELRRQFCAFLGRKYGHLGVAPVAWQGAMPTQDQDAGDDFAHGEAALYIVWELTQHRGGAGEAARCADQMEFLARTQRDWYQRIVDYLRTDLGCRQLINAGNWKTADNVTMLDAERWSYAPGDIMAINRYYTGVHAGANCGWAICAGDTFTDDSVLTRPRCLPIALKQVEGYPMMVPESSWVPPLSHLSEGPMLIAAYGALNGVGPYVWFATAEPAWATASIDSANSFLPSQGKWLVATPMVMGQWPAAALLYRAGYVRPGQPAVRERRALTDIWARGMPIIAEDEGYDPNRDAGLIATASSIKGGVDPLAYQVGPVRVVYGGDPATSAVIDLARYVDAKARTVRSDTGELNWDYGRGLCSLDAPKAQGATGFFAKVGGCVKLHDVGIECGNDYATVLAVALDDQPLAQSGRILVQVGTRAQSTGWRTAPTTIAVDKRQVPGERILSYGRAPWRIEDAALILTVLNPRVRTATELDCNGMAVREVPLDRTQNAIRLSFPPSALYVVLR